MDVKSAFLYGVLKEEIYMELPEGYREAGKVARLRKCIYGLKQSAREWYDCLATSLINKGFKPANFDPCVFIHTTQQLYVAVYVDDIMIFGPNTPFRTEVKTHLSSYFKCKDMGDAKFILGLEIKYINKGIELSQDGYINRTLEKFGYSNCRPFATPLEDNKKLQNAEPGTEIEQITDYQSLIGSLMYVVIGTRPDLTYAVTYLSYYSSRLCTEHLQAAYHILKYLCHTPNSRYCT